MVSATDDEREKLGEALYLKVSELQPEEVAGKITGMMLSSLEANEIQSVVDDEPSLREKVEEALQLLRKEAEKDQISFLQDELRQAEQWADGMQREWDGKESGWKKEKEELMSRIATLEGRAKKNKDSAEKVDEEKLESAKKRLGDVNNQNSKLEEDLRKMQQRAGELETALQNAQEYREHVENTTKPAKKKSSGAGKKKSDASALDDLEEKLQELETLAKATSQHATEAESLAKRAEAEVAEIEAGSPTEVASDKRKLQKELTKLQSEVEKYRSKVEVNRKENSEKISDAERDAQKAREERIRVEELIAAAEREMNTIRSH